MDLDETEAKLNRIFAKVLPGIKPTPEEVAIETNQANEIVNRLRKVVPKDVEIRVVGSLVRGTNLKGFSDIDVFLLFNKTKSKAVIEQEGLDYAQKIIGPKDAYELKYAEHPYLRAHLYSIGAEADIVPAYKIESIDQMATSVDRSPLHEEFVNGHLSSRQRDEVRLLKYFMKTHDLYGAEVATGGFSGYLCELLVYQFGDLLHVFKFFSAASLPILLNPKERQVSKDQALVRKFNSQFVVIDPVDPGRNVAAAVQMESLSKFVLLSRSLLQNPSLRGFLGRGFSHEEAKKEMRKFADETGLNLFLLIFKLPNKSEDILWPQLRRVGEWIKTFAESYGFNIAFVLPTIQNREGIIIILADRISLKARLVKGPDVFMPEAASSFIKSHKKDIGIGVNNTTLFAITQNRFPDIESLLKYVSKGKVKSRHKDIIIKNARLTKKVPEEYVDSVYSELRNKLKYLL
ncbi:MAG: CCA tRNA nucleotidyltransferase [Candidatus Micrarchaeia archaeon]